MTEIVILGICIISIVVCFFVMSAPRSGGRSLKKSLGVPEELQRAFREYAEELLTSANVLIEELKITRLDLLSEVPYEQGCFEYHAVEYNLVPENPIMNAHGMVLNSREIFAKAGLNDILVVLFYKEAQEIFEISFMPQKRVMMQGYKAHIETRYRNVKDWFKNDEYSLHLDDRVIVLWDNLMGTHPLPEIDAMRVKAEGAFSYSAQYIDIFQNEDIEIKSWVNFERKKEWIFSIKAKTHRAKTSRGIQVGDTVDALKEKYPMNLSYLENLDGMGESYGYIPEDETTRYIAFRTENSVITEIVVTDGFEERPFVPKSGYIDQDIPWIAEDISAKLTNKYARSLYLGQHKADLEARQVFNTFVANNFEVSSIIDKGLWEDLQYEREQIYFVICKNFEDGGKLYVEVKLKEILINTFSNDTPIWVVTHHRSQKKRG